MRRLNRASFVLLYFAQFTFSGLCLVFVVCLSSATYFPAYTDVNGLFSRIVLMCHLETETDSNLHCHTCLFTQENVFSSVRIVRFLVCGHFI